MHLYSEVDQKIYGSEQLPDNKFIYFETKSPSPFISPKSCSAHLCGQREKSIIGMERGQDSCCQLALELRHGACWCCLLPCHSRELTFPFFRKKHLKVVRHLCVACNVINPRYSNCTDILQKVKIKDILGREDQSIKANLSYELLMFGIFVVFTEDTLFPFFCFRNSK